MAQGNPMLKIIDKNLEEVLLVFLLSLMSVLIGVQIVMRYVVQESLTWSEELARLLLHLGHVHWRELRCEGGRPLSVSMP